MIPNAYEFHWDLGHVVFLGIFYGVVAIVLLSLALAWRRARRDEQRRTGSIRWHENFAELPAECRRCRHDFDGLRPGGVCEHGFACEDCARHRELEAAAAAGDGDGAPAGVRLPASRRYHRGHTWVEPQDDGTLRVGLDGLALRCVGRPDRVELPALGADLDEGDEAAAVVRGRLQAGITAPVAGRVVDHGNFHDGWLMTLEPAAAARLDHLLSGRAAEVWMLRELEWLQGALAPAGAAPALADGGVPVGDLVAACPDTDWDAIWGRVLLQP